jgi:hypothetical protein
MHIMSSISKRLNQFNFKIHKVSQQKRTTINRDVTLH